MKTKNEKEASQLAAFLKELCTLNKIQWKYDSFHFNIEQNFYDLSENTPDVALVLNCEFSKNISAMSGVIEYHLQESHQLYESFLNARKHLLHKMRSFLKDTIKNTDIKCNFHENENEHEINQMRIPWITKIVSMKSETLSVLVKALENQISNNIECNKPLLSALKLDLPFFKPHSVDSIEFNSIKSAYN